MSTLTIQEVKDTNEKLKSKNKIIIMGILKLSELTLGSTEH